jgi:hypothetical protein
VQNRRHLCNETLLGVSLGFVQKSRPIKHLA